MRWAVIGETGLFGSEMALFLERKGEKVFRFNRSNLDLEVSSEDLVSAIGPVDVIVNAVGYTLVDKAEHNLFEANNINAIYAGKLAMTASHLGSKFFHISSDYVFDGLATRPYSLYDETNPQTVYGKSKELGEQLVSQSGAKYSIFRTSWMYGADGVCFPRTLAAKLLGTGHARVVDDQVGTPTWTRDLAQVIYEHGVKNYNEKIVHAVASGSASWFDFSKAVGASLNLDWNDVLEPVSSNHFSSVAKRPKYSVLKNTETRGPIIGNWEDRWFVAAPEVLSGLVF